MTGRKNWTDVNNDINSADFLAYNVYNGRVFTGRIRFLGRCKLTYKGGQKKSTGLDDIVDALVCLIPHSTSRGKQSRCLLPTVYEFGCEPMVLYGVGTTACA